VKEKTHRAARSYPFLVLTAGVGVHPTGEIKKPEATGFGKAGQFRIVFC
jgi:hypothetical protein